MSSSIVLNGQVGLLSSRQMLAADGAFFTAVNATPGTGIALNAQVQAFAATNGFFVGQNASSTKSVILDSINLILTAATTAVVSTDFIVAVDTVTRTPATASTGTALVAKNVNGADSTASEMSWQAYNATGAMTIPAAGAGVRYVARAHVPTGLHVVGDLIALKFGGDNFTGGIGAGVAAARTSSSSPGTFNCVTNPVIVGPGQWVVVHRWSLTEAGAPTFEYEINWSEQVL